MKVHANQYLQFLNKNYNNHNIIFLYGTNNGLVNMLFRDTIKSLKIDENNPFLVSKIDGNELKENQSVLSDNLATITMFGEKKVILLNLFYTTITQTIEKLISDNITQKDNDFVLIIKAGSLSSKSNLIKFLQASNNCILVPCYDEEPDKIKTKIDELFNKYNLVFSNNFMSNLYNRFSSNSLVNESELVKLENFIFENNDISESLLLSFMTNNEDINNNKIIDLCFSGKPKEALLYFNNIYDNSVSNIGIIRQFGNQLKLIENLILLNKKGLSLRDAINKIKPPIFFKNIPKITDQCKMWSLKKLATAQKNLIKLEINCKSSTYPEKTLISQFILSTSLLAIKK